MQSVQLKVCWAVTAGGSVFLKLPCREHHRDSLVLASVTWNLGSGERSSEETASAGVFWKTRSSGGSLWVAWVKRIDGRTMETLAHRDSEEFGDRIEKVHA